MNMTQVRLIVLSIAVSALTACEQKPRDTYLDTLGALHTSAPNEDCLKSWFYKFDEYPKTFLPETSIEIPPKMDESLIEEALADQTACESLSSCWDSDSWTDTAFMQKCTRGRMKLRMEQYDYDFGG